MIHSLFFCFVQVSPAVDDGGRNEHVICVYTPDYQDTRYTIFITYHHNITKLLFSQVMRVENLMRSAGMAGDLLYKPDIFSTLGIYRSNKWGFRASIYTSKAMLLEGRSRITIAGSERCYYNSSKGFQCPEDLDIDKVNCTSFINFHLTFHLDHSKDQCFHHQAPDSNRSSTNQGANC